MSDLTGKVALVTGGGSGIGRGICERLARDGADVCIPDIDVEGAEMTANLVTQLGCRAHVLKANAASQVVLANSGGEDIGEPYFATWAPLFAQMDTMADKQGFLVKQGGNVKNWKRRWMVLKNGASFVRASVRSRKLSIFRSR